MVSRSRAGSCGGPITSITASLVAAAAIAVAAPAAAAKPSTEGPIPQTSCFWTGQIASKFSPGDREKNYAFPDTGAVYWTAKVTMPEDSKIVFKGEFSHSRYQSLNSYAASNNAPTDALNDVSTEPDPGSTNPFRPGARRDARKRSFTATMLNESAPATRAPNTLYAGVPGQSVQQIVLRVYRPDSFRERELTGGVGLPEHELHLADGSVQTGEQACRTLRAQSGRLALTTLPEPAYRLLRGQPGKPEAFPAEPTPRFRAFYSIDDVLTCWYLTVCSENPARVGGQYSNIDNNYVAAFVNRGFSDGPVLVLRGKLPTTPRTGPKVRKMGTGQMRYWSICQNESLYTTVGAGCLYDSQIPVDKRGNYTIVTSLGGDRPDNANRDCGVGYIPWPPAGDGAGNRDDGLLILRNMLPSSGFRQAVQNTASRGDEARVMGPYLPKGEYTTTTEFESTGC